MDCHGRRNRRGRGRSRPYNTPPVHVYTPPQEAKPWSCLSGVYSLLILSSLIAVLYMMLDYHCETCRTSYDMNEITKNIEAIATNLSAVVHNYYVLETKISRLSRELPKIEGQMEILEALTNSIDNKHDMEMPGINGDCANYRTKQETNTSDKVDYIPRSVTVGAD